MIPFIYVNCHNRKKNRYGGKAHFYRYMFSCYTAEKLVYAVNVYLV